MECHETDRLELFSDGVFAIAITLLVLELKVPKHEAMAIGGSLLNVLKHQGASFFAFVTSFFTVLVIWINHHNLFNRIVACDRAFMLLNGLLLFFVTFVPFPTSLVADYLGHDGQKTAILIYVGTYLCVSLVFHFLWLYVRKNPHIMKPEKDKAVLQALDKTYFWGPLCYVVTLLVGFFSPWSSMGLCLGLVVIPQLLAVREASIVRHL